MAARGEARIENAYQRGVAQNGNPVACALVDQVFEPCDAVWRGLGTLPASGLALREEFAGFDARRRFCRRARRADRTHARAGRLPLRRRAARRHRAERLPALRPRCARRSTPWGRAWSQARAAARRISATGSRRCGGRGQTVARRWIRRASATRAARASSPQRPQRACLSARGIRPPHAHAAAHRPRAAAGTHGKRPNLRATAGAHGKRPNSARAAHRRPTRRQRSAPLTHTPAKEHPCSRRKAPWPFIIISVVVIVIALIVFALTGETEVSGHWEFTF